MKTHRYFATRAEALIAIYQQPQPWKWSVMQQKDVFVIRRNPHKWRAPEPISMRVTK